jgi:hypothetical protein
LRFGIYEGAEQSGLRDVRQVKVIGRKYFVANNRLQSEPLLTARGAERQGRWTRSRRSSHSIDPTQPRLQLVPTR